MKKLIIFIIFYYLLFSCTTLNKIYYAEEFNKSLLILNNPNYLNDSTDLHKYKYIKKNDIKTEINFLENKSYKLFEIHQINYGSFKLLSITYMLYKSKDTIDVVSFLFIKNKGESIYYLNNIDMNNPIYYKLRRPKKNKSVHPYGY